MLSPDASRRLAVAANSARLSMDDLFYLRRAVARAEKAGAREVEDMPARVQEMVEIAERPWL